MDTVTTTDIIDKMKKRGFVVYSFGRSENVLTDILFVTNMNDSEIQPVINIVVSVRPDKFGYFTAVYQIPNSVNRLCSLECSPVMDDKQFDKIVGKVKEQAKVLEDFYSTK